MPATTTASKGLTSGDQSSLAFSHTSNADPLYVFLSWYVSGGIVDVIDRVVGVTFGGVALEQGGFLSVNGNALQWWRLFAPAAGAANVEITLSSGRRLSGAAVNLGGFPAALANHTFAAAGGFAATTQPSVTVDSASGSEVIDWLAFNDPTQVSTPGGAQSELWSQDGLGGGSGAGGDQMTAGSLATAAGVSVTTTWTLTEGMEYWGLGAISYTDADLPESTYEDGEPGTIPVFELTTRDGAVHPFSDRRLNDLETYYGGTKPARVLSFKDIRVALSDTSGQMEHPSAGVTLSDIPRDLRGLLDDEVNQYLTHCPAALRTVSDPDRRAELPMRTEFIGYIGTWSPRRDLQFDLDVVDWIKRKLAKRNKAPEFWQPLLTREDFGLLPDALVNKAAPFWWGRVSDAAEVATDGDLYPRGNWDPVWLTHGYNHVAPAAGPPAGSYCAYISAIKDGVESTVMSFMLGFTLDGSQQAYIYFKTAAVPDFYRVYFSDGRDVFHPFLNPSGGTFSRYRDYTPAEVPEDDDPFGVGSTNRYALIDSVTWGNDYQAIGSSGGAVLNVGRGAIPTLYVGDETYGGITRSAFLVQRWAMKDIESVHVGGVAQTSVGSATEIECPFLGDYASVFGANYRDINGRRYTIVYATGQTAINAINGSKPITVNGTGLEAAGDTSGAALTSPVRQHQWFVRLLAGAALPPTTFPSTSPSFPFIDAPPMLDDDAYDLAEAALAARLSGDPYETAGGVGVGGEYERALDILAALHVCGDFDSGFNRLGQVAPSVEPSEAPATEDVFELNDIRHIADGTFEASADPTKDFANVIPFTHTKDYTGITKSGWFFRGETRDQDSIDNHGSEQNANEASYRFLRANTATGQATIVSVVRRKRLRFRQPLRPVSLEVPYLVAANAGLGSVLRVAHLEGLTATGWEGHDLRVRACSVGLSGLTRRFECVDLGPIYDGLPDSDDPTQQAEGYADTSVVQLQENVSGLQVDLSVVQAEIVALDAAIAALGTTLRKRGRVRAATTASVTISTALNSGDTIDGVALATGDLVLVKNQAAPEQNGVYVVGASPARFSEFDTYDEHPGSLLAVEEGTANADTLWLCTSNVGGTLNTTALAFSSVTAPSRVSTIPFQIVDDGVTVITTGLKGFFRVPFACTITGWQILSTDAAGPATAGSIVVDLWKDTSANYPPTVADTITASAKPTLSAANFVSSTTLTGWTTSLAAGDVLAFNVDSAALVTRVLLQLTVSIP